MRHTHGNMATHKEREMLVDSAVPSALVITNGQSREEYKRGVEPGTKRMLA
jgi:hypothetical protein